tara:strand:- start:205 stop:456 length:252 start_codon:yes stop_codon:yes gene_type:complete
MNKQKEEDNAWLNDPDVQDFLEQEDEILAQLEEDKLHTVGGLTNDKEGDFMKFQNKMEKDQPEYDAYVDRQEEELFKILTQAH